MIARLLMALIRVYQLTLSKLIRMTLGDVCRFEPSCSRYAFACIRDDGALRGGLLSAKRLCRCHPFHPGGFDPPPPPRSDARALRSKMPFAVGQSVPPAGEAPNSGGAMLGEPGSLSEPPAAGLKASAGNVHDPSQRSSA